MTYDQAFLVGAVEKYVEPPSCLIKLVAELPIPDAFWTASASSTGKYHPTFSVGEGGLMHHTLLHMYWVQRWANFLGSKDSDRRIATVAAALHDTFKGGYDPVWTTTVPDHPFIAANEIRKCAALKASNEGIKGEWHKVAQAVWTHMGIFSADPMNPANKVFVPVTLDQMTEAGRLVALADYSAAQKVYDELDSIFDPFGDSEKTEDTPS